MRLKFSSCELLVLAVFAPAFGACLHRGPIPRDRQDAYFACPDIALDRAEVNLASDGWPIQTSTGKTITTGFLEIPLTPEEGRGESSLVVEDQKYGGTKREYVDSYSARIIVFPRDAGGIGFNVFFLFVRSPIVSDGEPLREIFAAQLDDEMTREQLNRFRKAVCGGAPYFARRGYQVDEQDGEVFGSSREVSSVIVAARQPAKSTGAEPVPNVSALPGNVQ